jgi:hypothetical protein
MSKDSSSLGKRLSRFIIVISAIGLGLSLAFKGIIGPKTFVLFIILAVIAAVIDSVWVKLILACAGIVFLLLTATNFNIAEFKTLASFAGILILMFFGLYVMFGGMRNRK